MATRRPLSCRIGFNAQHAPMGAFMSFTCGNPGTRGGIGLQIGSPGDQEVFIGVIDGDRYADVPLKCLPFYIGAASKAVEAFTAETAGPSEANVRPDAVAFDLKEITRTYGWCTDNWTAGDLSFTVYTPFGAIPDPAKSTVEEMREGLRPAVVAELVVDNTKGTKPKTGIFALNHARTGPRMITEDLGRTRRVGFAFRREAGVAGEVFDVTAGKKAGPQPFGFMRWSATDGIREKYNPVHLLGSCPGLGFEVPPGKKYAMVMAIGCYLEAPVTTGLSGTYLYRRYYKDLTDVLSSTLDAAGKLMKAAEKRDAKLESSPLSDDQKFLIAHATHSYYGSTQLLEVEKKPFWVVNEGEYCMMNTLDLAVDHVFWELDRNPWLVKNLLDNFARLYSYKDQIKIYRDSFAPAHGFDHDPSQPPPPPDAAQLSRPYDKKAGGISFCHDMGAHNNFAPRGRSSYELANLTSTFSYMTVEQLCNWTLTAGCYLAKTRDTAWLKKNKNVIQDILASMVNRGGEAGFAQFDSTKTAGGQEITTYDSLDHSLAQTRNNVYMAVKSWAAYRALALMFRDLGDKANQEKSQKLAEKVAGVVAAQAVGGILPAIFEKGNPGYHSRILPAVEGCVYPYYFAKQGYAGVSADEVYGTPAEKKMYEVLKEHTRKLLTDPQHRNTFDDGGIKLSSTSTNSWMSKICIFMHVTRKVFGLDKDPAVAAVFQKADAAHVIWEAVGSAYWACSDQIVSGEGKASRYYPRIITSALWMG